MSRQSTTEVRLPPYHFTISETEQRYGDRIINHSFKIGGAGVDCAGVGIQYDAQNQPIRASIPYIQYDPDCSKGVRMDRGAASIQMIKALLRHVHSQLPSITRFYFDDNSMIGCGTLEEQQSRRHPKKGAYARPIPLNYFSIAFNGYTWYEKHFHAKYKNDDAHEQYRDHVKEFLTEEKLPPIADFLQSLPAAPSPSHIEELEQLYQRASTYIDLFQSIPKEKRCSHARGWLIPFIKEKLNHHFGDKGWYIDIAEMDKPLLEMRSRGGADRRTRKRGKKYSSSYYCPKRIRWGGGEFGDDVGVDPLHL